MLTGDSSSAIFGEYLRRDDEICNCRRTYSCATYGTVMFSTGTTWYVVPESQYVVDPCEEPTVQAPLFIEDKALTPAGIGGSWSSSSSAVDPSIQVSYDVEVTGMLVTTSLDGTYARDGNCGDRPAFRCVTCGGNEVWLSFVADRATWIFGPTKGEFLPHYAAALDTVDEPVWMTADLNEFRFTGSTYEINSDINIAYGEDFLQPTGGGPVFPVLRLPTPAPTPQNSRDCGICDYDLDIEIFTDREPQETSWAFTMADPAGCSNDATTNSSNFLGMIDPLRRYTFSIHHLCRGRNYTLTMFDTQGNGLCCVGGQGSYDVDLENDLLFSGAEFNFTEQNTFMVPLYDVPTFEPTTSAPSTSPTTPIPTEARTTPNPTTRSPSPKPTPLPTDTAAPSVGLLTIGNETYIPLSKLAVLLPSLLPTVVANPDCIDDCIDINANITWLG